MKGRKQTFMTTMSAKRHLRELQWRLLLVAALFIVGAGLAYSYQSTLVPLLLNPLGGEKLVYLNPAGGFSFIFLISIYAGIALSFPILVQQLYAFLRPTLPQKAQKKSAVIIIGSLLLLVTGILFGYFVAVPNALAFLYGFADQYVEASLTAESYLNFMIAYTIGIGIVFQLPLLLLLFHTIKPLTPGGLLKSEKWVVLVAFIVAAIITPTPDPINQVIIAGPVVVIYQIGVIAVLMSIASEKRKQKAALRKKAPTQKAVKEVPQKVTLQPVAAHPQAVKPVAQAQQPQVIKTVDGFMVRRGAPQLQVPAREAPLPMPRPQPRPQAQKQVQTPSKGFYVDGIIGPRQAMSL